MRQSVLPFLLSAAVLCAAAPHVHAQVHFQCNQGTLNVNESAGAVTLEMTRDGDLNLWAQAAFSVEEQTGPGKWTQVGNTYWSALFAPGSNLATVAVPMNDGIYTGNRVRRAICFGFLAPNSGGSSVGNVFINIDEDEPFPTIIRPDFVVQEGDPDPPYVSVSVPFTLSAPFGRTTALRAYGYSGTASYADFGVTTDFTIQANTTNAWLTIHIAHDDIAESDEMFEVQIVESNVVRKTFNVTILDDDSAPFPVSFSQADYAFHEGTSNSVTLTRGGNTAVAGAGTLHVVSDMGQVWPADVPVAFAAGQASKTVEMPFNDQAFGGNRLGVLQFIAPNGFVAAEAPVGMDDDDPMPVLSIAGGEVLEGASGETKQADVTLTLTAPLAVDLELSVATVNGTATADDYNPLEKKVFFAPGSISQKVAVTIRGDGAAEGDETIRVEIRQCCSSLALVDQHSATITIRDDDSGDPDDVAPTYRFVRPMTRHWNESQQWLQATIVRSGSGIDRAASVFVKLAAGPARQFEREVRFRRGETQAVARFYIDDPFYSGSSIGTIELIGPTGRQDQEPIDITENETKPVITFSDDHVTEGDADRTVALVVTVTPPSFLPIQAKFALSAFGVSLSNDINGIRNNQEYTLPGLRSTVPIPFDVVGDNEGESTESFDFTLRAVDPAVATVRGSAIFTIHDDDRPAATLYVPPGVARGATATITFTLSSIAPADETFAISTTTPELLSVPASVLVRGGTTSATFEVSALAAGNATIAVKLTPRLLFATITESLFVYRLVTPILPERVRVPVGTTVLASVAFSETVEGEVQLALASDDRSIAATAASDVLGTDSSMIAIHGVSIGSTRLAITMPTELGGTTAYLPVDVYEPVAERKRAARH